MSAQRSWHRIRLRWKQLPHIHQYRIEINRLDNHCRHFSRDGRELLFSRESLMGVILICHNQILDAVLQGQIPRPYIFQAY